MAVITTSQVPKRSSLIRIYQKRPQTYAVRSKGQPLNNRIGATEQKYAHGPLSGPGLAEARRENDESATLKETPLS